MCGLLERCGELPVGEAGFAKLAERFAWKIGQDQIQQPRPLSNGTAERFPFLGRHQQLFPIAKNSTRLLLL